jgi:transposase
MEGNGRRGHRQQQRLLGALPRWGSGTQFGAHQCFLLGQQLAHIEHLEATIAEVSAEITERLCPVAAEQERLETIPGVGHGRLTCCWLSWDPT